MKKILLIIGCYLVINLITFGEEINNDVKIVYLCGENHANENDIRFKNQIMYRANNNELVYAHESISREIEAERLFLQYVGYERGIYGVESALYSIFMNAVEIAVLRDAKDLPQPNEKDFLRFLVLRPNQSFLDKFWEQETLSNNAIFTFLKKHKDALSKSTMQVQHDIFVSQIKKFKNKDWIDFSRQILLELGPIIAKQISNEKLQTLEFLMQSGAHGLKLERFSTVEEMSGLLLRFGAAASLELRDDFIINNIAEIYSIAKGKPLVSILGKDHIKAVKEGLKNKGFTVLGKKEFLTTYGKNGKESLKARNKKEL